MLLGSIQYLFNLHFPDRLFAHLWATGAALLGPLFAFAMIPIELDEPFQASDLPAALESAVVAVLNFALAPLVLAYAAMLHVYAATIAVRATMPKGELGPWVVAFGIIGTISYMIAYPWRERGWAAVRWLVAGWFWLMIIPALLLVLAGWERIHQYGVTPERYCLFLFALWLVAMAMYLGAMHRRIDLRAIPLSLGIGLLLSSFGPWGAVAVSTRSQLRELRRALEDKHLLTDDRLQLAPPNIATFRQLAMSDQHLQSILKELDDLDALKRIAPLFAAIDDNPFKRATSDNELHAALGVATWPPPLPPPPVPLEVDLAHYDRMLGPMWIGDGGISVAGPNEDKLPTATIGVTRLTFSKAMLRAEAAHETVTFDLIAARAKFEQNRDRNDNQSFMVPAREGVERGAIVIKPAWPSWSDEKEVWLLLGSR